MEEYTKEKQLDNEMELAAVAMVVEEEALWLKVDCETISRETSIEKARQRIAIIRSNLHEMEQRIQAIEAKYSQGH